MQLRFRQNALGQAAADRRQTEGAADIERQVPDAVAESQQRLDGRQRPVAAGRRQLAERVGELLQVGEGDRAERLPCPRRNRSISAR